MADSQFNESLQKLAEWGKYLDGQERDLQTKLAKQGGKSGVSASGNDDHLPAQALAPAASPPPENQNSSGDASDDDWLDELLDEDDSTPPPRQSGKIVPVDKEDADADADEDVVVF